MGTRIDLTQFWRDRPEFVGRDKEFGIIGTQATVLLGTTGNQIVVPIPQTFDFIATAGYLVPFLQNNSSAIPGPAQANIQLPSGRWIVNTQAQSNNSALRGQDITTWLSNGFKVSWDWPYPIVFPAASSYTLLYDNSAAFNLTVNVALHGIKVFPYDVSSLD